MSHWRPYDFPFVDVRNAVERTPRNQGNDAIFRYQGKHLLDS